MSRFAGIHRVFYFEEPVFEDGKSHLRMGVCPSTQVHVCTPVLPDGLSPAAIANQERELLDALILEKGITEYVAWYYTPMAREFSRHLQPLLTVYDCMDELSAFAGAPPAMAANETELFEAASLVFTGGASLYDAKRRQHDSVHLYPSSVDVDHFSKARSICEEPADQKHLPHPRIGFAGVIDERMNLPLLSKIAELRPEWQFILLGPVAKIDESSLPRAGNVHYLGMKPYKDLPSYFSGWDIGMLPFAHNRSTRFISPTKTPEYLAAGLNVISTSITDVVKPYGELGFASIADTPEEFVKAAEKYLANGRNKSPYDAADGFLALSSWNKTWGSMNADISAAIDKKQSQKEMAVFAAAYSTKGTAHV